MDNLCCPHKVDQQGHQKQRWTLTGQEHYEKEEWSKGTEVWAHRHLVPTSRVLRTPEIHTEHTGLKK